jgi:hypothetical protein
MDDNTKEQQGRHDDGSGDIVMVEATTTDNTDATSDTETSSRHRLSPEEIAVEWRDKGNSFYSEKKLLDASKAYHAGLKTLEEGGLPSATSSSLAIILRSNQALVFLKMREFQLAEQECSKVLEVDPDNVKGMFRILTV